MCGWLRSFAWTMAEMFSGLRTSAVMHFKCKQQYKRRQMRDRINATIHHWFKMEQEILKRQYNETVINIYKCVHKCVCMVRRLKTNKRNWNILPNEWARIGAMSFLSFLKLKNEFLLYRPSVFLFSHAILIVLSLRKLPYKGRRETTEEN